MGKLRSDLRFQDAIGALELGELTISSKYTEVLRELPLVHGDPFDRMMVAQAILDGMILVTADRRLWEYPVAVLRV